MTSSRPGLPLRVYLGNQSCLLLPNRGDLIQGIHYKDDEKALKINKGTGRQKVNNSMRLLLSLCNKKTMATSRVPEIMAFQRKLGP